MSEIIYRKLIRGDHQAAPFGLLPILVGYLLFAAGVAWAEPAGPPGGVKVPPTDPNLLYLGRWDKTDPKTYHGFWIAAYVRTEFTGTSVAVQLEGHHGLDVIIDGEPVRVVQGEGVVPLNTSPLANGPHTLLVGVKGGGGWGFRGLVLDPGASTNPPAVKPIIEFVGDSITTASSGSPLEAAGNYSWRIAESLGCDHTQICWPGRSLMTGYGFAKEDKRGLDTQYFQQNCFYDKPDALWDLSYTPQVIVINLGQNDGAPSDDFRNDYIEFLKNIRARMVDVQILVLRPFSGNQSKGCQEAVTAVTTAGDAQVLYVDTTDWLDKTDFGDGVHPNDTGNQKVADHLSPIIKPFLKAP